MINQKKVHGFTLIELTVVLFILGLVAAITTPNIVNTINDYRAKVTISETQSILDAARNYRAQTGTWPGDGASLCSGALTVLKAGAQAYLVGVDGTNHYNSPVTTSCTAQTFSVDQNVIADWDGVVANQLPSTEIVNAGSSLIRSTIGVPGSEPALDGKLSRAWSGNAELNRMRTQLLLGGNNISEVNTLNAQSAVLLGLLDAKGASQFTGEATFNETLNLSKVVTVGAYCAKTGSIARDAAGATVSCQGGQWKGPSTGGSWGGSFFTSPGHGGCYSANPLTGSCSCPTQYSAYLAYAIQVGGCYPCTLYQCSKPL